MTGYDTMPVTVARATNDIRHHLWALYFLSRTLPATTVVELGVRSGDSTRAFLAAAEDIGTNTMGEKAFVYSFDQAGDAYDVKSVTESYGIPHFGDRWTCKKSHSILAAMGFGEWSVDLVFVDTDHSFDLTQNEIKAWHTKVRPGGIMAFHDVGLDEPGRDGVSPAIREFMAGQFGRYWTYEEHRHVAEGDCGLGWMTRAK